MRHAPKPPTLVRESPDCPKSTGSVIARVLAPAAISQNCFEISISFSEFEAFYMGSPRRFAPRNDSLNVFDSLKRPPSEGVIYMAVHNYI